MSEVLDTVAAETTETEEVESSLVEVTATKELEDENGNTYKVAGTVTWDPGANAEEAIEKFGDECVYDFFIRSANVKLQSQIRARVADGATQEMIDAEFVDWRPDVDRSPTRDPKSSILSSFNKLDEDEREQIIALLKAGLLADEG